MTETVSQTYSIEHPILGRYEQEVFDDLKDAGHVDLVSQGKYGWEMPQDLPTVRLLEDVTGKMVLDLGCGWGNKIVIPAMENGAAKVYALDIMLEHLGSNSPMSKRAHELNYMKLYPVLIAEDWWRCPTLSEPNLAALLQPKEGELPADNTIDLMTMRHVLHFGSPDTLMNVFDLVSMLLSPKGKFAAINFTPYTGYLYNYNNGKTLAKIIAGNKHYALGKASGPMGYLSKNNSLGVSLAELLDKPALKDRDCLYFDDDTLHGLLNAWAGTRKGRGLPVDLELETSYYFSPSKIAGFNKMAVPEFKEKENHYFVLRKVAV